MNPSQLSEFVLKLVSSAVDSYPAVHQQNMIGLVREVVTFDAAWWGWSSFNAGLTTLVNSTTYNLPPDYETAFNRVSGKDPFIRFGKRLKDFALSLPTDDPSLQDEFRDFLSDFGIRATLNGHCRLQGPTSYNFFMSLYRFDRGARFSPEETADFRLILRHLEQSLSLSLRAELRSLAPVDGAGANLDIPLLPGAGHRAYLDVMELLVLPAIRTFEPDMIVIASGFDANAFDPLSRMQAHSGTFREMTRQVMALADDICQGRIVAVHEGGYAEVVVPFCGLATLEQLSGIRTDVVDPFEEITDGQQPAADFTRFQRRRLEAQAQAQ